MQEKQLFPSMLYSMDGRLTEDIQGDKNKPLLTGTSPCSQEQALAHRNKPLLAGTSPCAFRWLQRCIGVMPTSDCV